MGKEAKTTTWAWLRAGSRAGGRGNGDGDNDGELVPDSDEEQQQQPEHPQPAEPVSKKRSRAKAAVKPKAKVKANPKVRAKRAKKTKNDKGESTATGSTADENKQDTGAKEPPIVWGPVFKDKVSYLFDPSLSEPGVCLSWLQDAESEERDEGAGKRKVKEEKDECEMAVETAEIPAKEIEEPPAKSQKQAATFARRPCPKHSPSKQRWEVIRGCFHFELRRWTQFYGLQTSQVEASLTLFQFCFSPPAR